MGLTGGLVKSVFSKNRSVCSYDNNMKSCRAEKRKWSSVRSYLCGDEFNSVLAEDDSASLRSLEATFPQSVHKEELKVETEIQNEENSISSECNSKRKLTEEEAAIVIQSAFRCFLAKHKNECLEKTDEIQDTQGIGSPSKESIGTSVEAQTGGSVEFLTFREEKIVSQHRMQQKARLQASHLKEDWDDSTLSSNISKLRIQNKMEATTRRERALAYAFSQQLRICSKKKEEANLGWTWLERWMATRQSENSTAEDSLKKHPDMIYNDQKSPVNKNYLYAAAEESCGSNEVFVGVDYLRITAPKDKDGEKPAKNRLKVKRTLLRRKTMPSYQYSTEFTKVTKKDNTKEAKKEKIHKQLQQSKSAREYKYDDVASEILSTLVNNNKSE